MIAGRHPITDPLAEETPTSGHERRHTHTPADITAVVCTYTEERWDQFTAAVDSLLCQSPPPREVLVVVDHAEALAARVKRELPGVRVLENTEAQGLSGGRNTALRAAESPLVAFLDDDAVAAPGWLARLGAHFDDPRVLGAGGSVTPMWENHRPSWFPPEFDWVLGCTYEGLPRQLAEVRNPFGGAMVIRRDAALAAGGYRTDLGRIGKHPLGCEETELCIRLRSTDPSAKFLYDPTAEIHHHAPKDRCTWSYFRRRCYAEGLSKAVVRSIAGQNDGLSAERGYVLWTLPRAVLRGLFGARGDNAPGRARAVAIAAGLAWTTAGFLVGTVDGLRPRADLRRRRGERPGEAPEFRPAWVGAVDLEAPIEDLAPPPSASGGAYHRALVVVLLHRQPIGVLSVELDDERVPAEVLRERIVTQLGSAITAHLDADRAPRHDRDLGGPTDVARGQACWFVDDASELPPFSVVLCTRNRPEQAELAIEQLRELDYPNFEIVIVDNAPVDDATKQMVTTLSQRDPRVRYVREEVPGLASARNRGVAAARSELVAFTDDDIRVPRWWLRALAHGFERTPEVVCVTGSVVAAALETRAEELFDQAVASGTKWGFGHRLFRVDDPPAGSPLFPYQVGVYGGGGNAAFVRSFLTATGGFDPALGAGTPSRGGEDLDAFLRVVTDGHHLAYEPSALVWHLHHTDDRQVRKQTFHYGVGLGAFLFKIACSRRHARHLLARSLHGFRYLFSSSSEKNAQKGSGFPASLTAIELLGIAWGPVAYLQSRRHFPGAAPGVAGDHDPWCPHPRSGRTQNGGRSYTRT